MTPRKLQVLKVVAHYYTLVRSQIQQLVDMRNDRVMRQILQDLYAQGLINKTRMEVVNPRAGAPAPVYFPTRRGCEVLAAVLEDEQYLHACTRTPDWQHLFHWTQVAEFHIVLDRAISRQNEVGVDGWLGEWDVANPEESEPHKRYSLFTLLREKPRLVCAPDAGFLLGFRGFRKVYFLELDRASSGVNQISHSKPAGFAELAKQKLHRRHFPTENVGTFSVIHASPNAGRRDLLRRALRGKDRADLHKFVAWPDWTPERALHAEVFFSCDDDQPQPLIKRAEGGEA